MKGWIDFMGKNAKDYIWNYKLQFGDWVGLDAEEGSYFGAAPNDLICTACFAYSTGLFARMARVLGREREVKKYEELYQKIVEKYHNTFFQTDGTLTARTVLFLKKKTEFSGRKRAPEAIPYSLTDRKQVFSRSLLCRNLMLPEAMPRNWQQYCC